jgi:tetratricopeptide (TPR) repeat protein
LLDKPLHSLTLARAYFKLENYQQAARYFDEAVAGIRKAGKVEFTPIFLIDRANFYLDQQQFNDALRDLDEARQIIERSKMNLYAVDYHLAMCRYVRLQQPSEAQQHLETAKVLITVTGYHLRDKDV